MTRDHIYLDKIDKAPYFSFHRHITLRNRDLKKISCATTTNLQQIKISELTSSRSIVAEQSVKEKRKQSSLVNSYIGTKCRKYSIHVN